jgi:hypothetical protein
MNTGDEFGLKRRSCAAIFTSETLVIEGEDALP